MSKTQSGGTSEVANNDTPYWFGYSNEPTNLERNDLQGLLSYHHEAELKALDLFAHHKNIWLAAITALLVAGVVALTIDAKPIQWITFFIPIIIVYLRWYVSRSLDRYYQRFLEAVVVTKKLEFMLGYDRKVCTKGLNPNPQPNLAPYPKDRYLDVDRRLVPKENEEASSNSKMWIYNHMFDGHNKVVSDFLRAICIFSILIPVFGLCTIIGFCVQDSAQQVWNKLFWHPATGLFITTIVLSMMAYIIQDILIRKRRQKEQRIQSKQISSQQNKT